MCLYLDSDCDAYADLDRQNMTGPGRPGREDQASLTAMAVAGYGWDYPTLLQNMLHGASTLETFRQYRAPL